VPDSVAVRIFSDEMEGLLPVKIPLAPHCCSFRRTGLPAPFARPTPNSCAGCDDDYCDCTEKEWGLGEDDITYCSQDCADRNGKKNE
jgi:hypothetical protein